MPRRSATAVAAQHADEQRARDAARHQHRHHRERAEREQRPAATSGGRASRACPATSTTIAAHSRPISAMSRPMPAPIACFSESGTARDHPLAQADARREDEDEPGDRDRAERDRPRRAPPTTTVNAKKKLWPIAGATAIG